MSEEDNWRVYKIELHDTMIKGTCVPFLGQLLTQILQQETVKEVISYRKKSQGRRPQSGDLSSDARETLSAPTTPVNSDHDDVTEILSPTDLNLALDQTTPTQPNFSNEETKSEEVNDCELKCEDESIKKQSSITSIVERRDKLSPLPIRKFKKNHLLSHKENHKPSSLTTALRSPTKNGTEQSESDNKVADNKSKGAECEVSGVVKSLSFESLDSYDGASSCYSRGSTPPKDIVPNAVDSETDDVYYNNDVLDVSQVELSISNTTMDTHTSDFDREGSPDTNLVTTSTPTEDIQTINTLNEDNIETITVTNFEVKKSPIRDGKKRRRWNSLRRKASSPEIRSLSVTNCTDSDASFKKDTDIKVCTLQSTSSPSCTDNTEQKKDRSNLKLKELSPARDSSPNCNDETLHKKKRRSLRRKPSSNWNNDPPQRREKLHIYDSPDMNGINVHMTLQQMQMSSMRYMVSLDARPEVQSFIKGLQYNSEEDNYHMSILMEPIEQNY